MEEQENNEQHIPVIFSLFASILIPHSILLSLRNFTASKKKKISDWTSLDGPVSDDATHSYVALFSAANLYGLFSLTSKYHKEGRQGTPPTQVIRTRKFTQL